jgi:protein O-GlcNAc transferase
MNLLIFSLKHLVMFDFLFAKYVLKMAPTPEKKWALKRKYPRQLFTPHMTMREYLLFEQLCKDKKVFLEYGSGGSTIYFLKNHKSVYTVESNEEFYHLMNSVQLVQRSKGQLLHSKFIDLGTCNQWGKPLTSEKESEWPRYYREIWEDIHPEETTVDVVFIDGRFRVCCCLYSILKVMEYGWKDTLFLFHDFWRRKKYHVVLKFLNEYKSKADLAAFKVKDTINLSEVRGMIGEYATASQ